MASSAESPKAATLNFFEIPAYHEFLSPRFADELLRSAKPVSGIEGLVEIGTGGGLETRESLQFLVDLYQFLKNDLNQVLEQRIRDRNFLDQRVRACFEYNQENGRAINDPNYVTVLGLQDGDGRTVMGPLRKDYCKGAGTQVAPIPEFLQGPHVTLFGPPSTAKMAINAMNAYHRKTQNEPAIVGELLKSAGHVSPMWGADDEDSKTPLRSDLIEAGENLSECFDGTLKQDSYELAKDHLALPIKRFPGLALPSSFLFLNRNPIPLHLYDFALHLFRHWNNEKALVFYVPKLETEEEAKYIHKMVATAEKMIQAKNPKYKLGSVRLMIVLENPRAILRTHEIMDALYPYFVGASLGWHDYLASMARIFKEDGNYRIPVKADPGIVIKYIKASHDLLADVVGPRGGIRVGGMYGILPIAGNHESLQITLKGFFKDVITQMKRDLTGFWVAHPDFMRIGIAIVEGWKQRTKGNPKPLTQLVEGLLDPKHQKDILSFIDGPDIESLDINHPNYVRSLMVADLKESDYIANNHPDEIRYNVFQTLQYLTDWLSGNGCVALPTIVEGVPVRVMDDLATAERSRWEVWHEIYHKRFSVEDFLKIVHEEMNFIRRDLYDERKIVQVKWDNRTAKWYPIAQKIMVKLMTDPNPAEFVSEYLVPFTVDRVRNDEDPWAVISQMDPGKFGPVRSYVADYDHYFEICGSQRFAKTMAQNCLEDLSVGQQVVMSFSVEEIIEAASFHGNIGDSRRVLDARAAGEQALVLDQEEAVKKELRSLGETYLQKFGFKFLISAKGKTAAEMKKALEERLKLTREQEIQHAREALWEITRKRLGDSPRNLLGEIENLRRQNQITGLSIAVSDRGTIQEICLGEAIKGKAKVESSTLFEIASLSKTIASAFAMEYFAKQKISLHASVDSLFAKTKSKFRVGSDKVTLEHLMSHGALNMHYVNGFPLTQEFPALTELLEGQHGYQKLAVLCEPGKEFHYSGGGFIVLEHLIESLEGRSIKDLTAPFLKSLSLKNLTFDYTAKNFAHGYLDNGSEVQTGRLNFPAFAAGALGSARDVTQFLQKVAEAYQDPNGVPGLSHDTAALMLKGTDRGAKAFMGCEMGLGVFVAEAGENRLMIHQGANDGFRALFVHCFSGPSKGRGFTILTNGDNNAVKGIADIAKILFAALKISGLNLKKLYSQFDYKNIPQEQIVNLGYKNLLFDSFLPDLPEEIVRKGPRNKWADQNLAIEAKVLEVSNQKFARAENLLSPFDPVFEPDLYGRQGKIMDSWETARHNPVDHDHMIIELKQKSEIKAIHLSTKYHDGNHAEFVRLMGFDGKWFELLPKTPMTGHAYHNLKLSSPAHCTQVRIEMYPDGGFTRFGLFAEIPKDFVETKSATRFTDPIPQPKKPLTIPFEATRDGMKIIKASNEHYSPARQVLSPFPPLHMFDGLESARSRKPGHHEEVIIALEKPGKISRIELDFKYFINNNPVAVRIDGISKGKSVQLADRTNVKAFAGNKKVFLVNSSELFEQICIQIFPDGGINRIRVFQ